MSRHRDCECGGWAVEVGWKHDFPHGVTIWTRHVQCLKCRTRTDEFAHSDLGECAATVWRWWDEGKVSKEKRERAKEASVVHLAAADAIYKFLREDFDRRRAEETECLMRIVAQIEGWKAAGEVPAEEFIAFLLDEVRNELKG